MVHYMSVHPQIRISSYFIEKSLNLIILIPVVKEPINRFVLSKFVVVVSLTDLICPRVRYRFLIMVDRNILVFESKLLSITTVKKGGVGSGMVKILNLDLA
jgi:hypothetical protein